MRPSLIVIASVSWVLLAGQARGEDAIMFIEDGRVELCVTAKAPSEPLDPHVLINGSSMWASDRSSRGFGVRLRASLGGEVVISGQSKDLMLAYSRETRFASIDISLKGDPGQIEYGRKLLDEALAKVVPAVTGRAQVLGAKTEDMRITGLAYADLDGDGSVEIIVEASSAPDPASAETAHPGQFAGVFVLAHDGALVGDRVRVLGREEDGSRFGMRVAAIGRNPFVDRNLGHWDFLFETIYESPVQMGVDIALATDQSTAGENARTWSRTIELMYYDAGQFASRNQIARVESTTCFGVGCER